MFMRSSWWVVLWRAIRLRCPRCGEGRIFRRWWRYEVLRSCDRRGLVYDPNGELVAFIYLSTAFITGLMLIVLITVPPEHLVRYRKVIQISGPHAPGVRTRQINSRASCGRSSARSSGCSTSW